MSSAYGATIGDRGTGSTKRAQAESYTMSCELELVAGRLGDLPGCAVSAVSVVVVSPHAPFSSSSKVKMVTSTAPSRK